MIKIKPTKNFSLEQAVNMAKNLEKKYNQPASIQCDCTSYREPPIMYYFYIAEIHHQYAKTWTEVQGLYQDYINVKIT